MVCQIWRRHSDNKGMGREGQKCRPCLEEGMDLPAASTAGEEQWR